MLRILFEFSMLTPENAPCLLKTFSTKFSLNGRYVFWLKVIQGYVKRNPFLQLRIVSLNVVLFGTIDDSF